MSRKDNHKRWRDSNKEKLALWAQEYRKKNAVRVRETSRKSDLKKKGLTIEQYEKMYLDQDGCCKICRRLSVEFKRALHVDHCHETGKVRGLLCHNCNHLIGNAYDSIIILESAIRYLAESE